MCKNLNRILYIKADDGRSEVRGILFGASVTIHKENAKEVLSEEFLEDLRMSGCKAVIYVEYVPVDHASMELAFDDSDRKAMQERLAVLKEEDEKMLYIAFPGDEKSSGGCLAAGRGFSISMPAAARSRVPFLHIPIPALQKHLWKRRWGPLYLKGLRKKER